MDTRGLFLGIDINEDISQVCFYDKSSRNVMPVFSKENDPYFQNNISLSAIFADENTAPSRLSSMIKALVSAACMQTGEGEISVIGVCVRDLAQNKRKIWHDAFSQSGISRDKYILMGKAETFAYYAYSSDPETYARGVVLFELEPEGLSACFLQRVSYKGFTLLTESDENISSVNVKRAGSGDITLEEAEQEICGFLKSSLDKTAVSSAYLTGAAFDREELPDGIISVLGRRGQRIFAGMNLYVKGACIGALAKANVADPFKSAGMNKSASLSLSAAAQGCIMACRNRLSSDIYVVEKRRGELKPRLLAAKGANVDESCMSFDCILGESGQIQLEVQPLTSNTPDIYRINVKTKKDTAKESVRVRVSLFFPHEDEVNVLIEGVDGSCSQESLVIDLRGSDEPQQLIRTDGVIYCESPIASVPYVFPATGDEIFSAEELVRFLYENVYLTPAEGGFVNEDLFSFLRESLGLKELAAKAENLWKSGGGIKEVLLVLFKEINYYSPQDILIMEPVIDGLATGKRALVKYGRAEAYIGRGCFSKALRELQEIMELNPDPELPESFYAKVLYNSGVCYARCLMYERAAQMFEGSFGFVKDDGTKAAALLARRLSGTEPGILYMRGEWESAGERAEALKREWSEGDGTRGAFAERFERLKADYLRKYS